MILVTHFTQWMEEICNSFPNISKYLISKYISNLNNFIGKFLKNESDITKMAANHTFCILNYTISNTSYMNYYVSNNMIHGL